MTRPAELIPERWSRAAALIAGAFSVAATLAQVLEMAIWLRGLVVIVTLASVGLAAALYFQARRYENALRWRSLGTGDDAAQVSGFVLRPVGSEVAFREVCRVSEEIYGPSNVPVERTLSWWKRFPDAVFAAYRKDADAGLELAAYLSIWPIKRATYDKLRAGRLRERDISYHAIEGLASPKPRRYWYVSNIVVATKYRKGPVLRLLLQAGVRRWLEHGQLPERVHVLALAFSKEGAALLRRYGFILLAETSADGWPIYELESETATLKTALAEIA